MAKVKSKYGDARSKKVKDFLKEVVKLSKKFELSLSHEDQHGGFEVEDYDDCFSSWILQASDRTTEE